MADKADRKNSFARIIDLTRSQFDEVGYNFSVYFTRATLIETGNSCSGPW
jgi:hypothetical protein